MIQIQEPNSDATVTLAQELISHDSTSPDRSGAQEILIKRLVKRGFTISKRELSGCNNFWAHLGNKKPLIVFSGHSDVVPPGDRSAWQRDPYQPYCNDGYLYGRGAADMKGALAAMVLAVEKFIDHFDSIEALPCSIGFLITGDEELGGSAAEQFLAQLVGEGLVIDSCIVGEPTSEERLGDTVKIGRRGSMQVTIQFFGVQGHVGYPHRAVNAIHEALEPLNRVTGISFNDGTPYFSPTTLQLTSITGGVASNVIPGEMTVQCNIRFPQGREPESIYQDILCALQPLASSRYAASWRVQSLPFLTAPGALLDAVQRSLVRCCGSEAKLSTAGGTSDARFFAYHGIPVIEVGPINKTIHQVNESLAIADLVSLTQLYFEMLDSLSRQVGA
jgi:succinyl-diaminopimelate desuccinylase